MSPGKRGQTANFARAAKFEVWPLLRSKRAEGAGVLHQVGGGGGAHGAEALDQAEDEEDESFGGLADAEGFGAFLYALLKRSVFEAAAQVERGHDERAAEVGCESGRGPHGAGGEESGEDGFGAADAAAKGANGGSLLMRVAEPLTRKSRLDFEDGVDALGGEVRAGGVREQGRRV